MPNEIKGSQGQHPIDMCLMGQGSLDEYVSFLRLNSINSNNEITANRAYTFVQNAVNDVNIENLVSSGQRIASIDNVALVEMGVIQEESNVSLYSTPVYIYSNAVNLY